MAQTRKQFKITYIPSAKTYSEFDEKCAKQMQQQLVEFIYKRFITLKIEHSRK